MFAVTGLALVGGALANFLLSLDAENSRQYYAFLLNGFSFVALAGVNLYQFKKRK